MEGFLQVLESAARKLIQPFVEGWYLWLVAFGVAAMAIFGFAIRAKRTHNNQASKDRTSR